jgi:hypothetical protein
MDTSFTISVSSICSLFSGQRFSLGDEKLLQQQIDHLLSSNYLSPELDYIKEYALTTSQDDIPDFYFPSIKCCMEIKVKGRARAIYEQCSRYCQHQDVLSLILITNKSMGFPSAINGKPCFVLNLGKAWL